MSLTPSALRLGSDFRGSLEMSGQALTVLPGFSSPTYNRIKVPYLIPGSPGSLLFPDLISYRSA